MVPVGDKLTDLWPLSPIGFLFRKTRSSWEYWGPWTDGDSYPLILPIIRSLSLLKTCQLLIGNQPSVIQLWSFYWYNMTLILEFLYGTSLIQTFYLGLCFSKQIIIYNQDNMKLKLSWTIHRVHNQPNLCLITFPKPILTLLWLLGSHSMVFTPGLCNLGYKTYMAQTCLTACIPYFISGVQPYIHI